MTYHGVFNKSNTTSATSGAGTVYPYEHMCSSTEFNGVRVACYFGFWVVFCRLLFVFLTVFF